MTYYNDITMRNRSLRRIRYIFFWAIALLNSSHISARAHKRAITGSYTRSDDNSMGFLPSLRIGSKQVAFLSAEPKLLQQKRFRNSYSEESPRELFAGDTINRQGNDRKKSELSGSNLNVDTLLSPGQVLLPSLEGDETQFDTACVANPVVIPPNDDDEMWQMYYYGNAGSWNCGMKSFLPTGWIGLAESTDGIQWKKVLGPSTNGCVFAPSDVEDDWDSVHVGLGDIVRISRSELHMYYFGGSMESVPIGPGSGVQGLRLRIGRAKSLDNGRTWERIGMALDYDEQEGLFASWPRIIIPEQGSLLPWRMIYHTYDAKNWRVFSASSGDKGDTWKREGLLLEGNTECEDSFDFLGIGTRDISPWRDGLLMVYEGVSQDGTHSLGAAFCPDENGDGPWTKIEEEDWTQSGGPLAQPGVGAMGEWTTQVIGTPYLVTMPDGSLRLYHCAKRDSDTSMSIGLIISESGNISPKCWSAGMPSTIKKEVKKARNECPRLVDVVQDIAGLTDAEWKRITSRFPEIILYDAKNCEDCLSKIQQRLSLSQLDLKKKIILRLPQMLGYDYDTDIGPELSYLQEELLLTDDELTTLILKCPQIVGLEYEGVIRPQIEAIKKGSDLAATKDMILQKPAALKLPVRGGASNK